MLEKIKAKKNYFYIGIGLLLIGAGLTGNLITFFAGGSDGITGAYRYVEKITQPNSFAIDPNIVSVAENTEPVVVEESAFSASRLDNFSYFIHPTHNRSLEIPLIPEKIEIPAINLVAPVHIAEFNFTDIEGETFGQWIPPSEFAAAWHPNSGLLGQNGNTVINGHHNEFGEVFGKLVDLESGDIIYVYAKGKKFTFVISNKMILLEKGQPVDVRMANAEWLGKTDDVRLTLVTCWPEKSNTHRLILVARPY